MATMQVFFMYLLSVQQTMTFSSFFPTNNNDNDSEERLLVDDPTAFHLPFSDSVLPVSCLFASIFWLPSSTQTFHSPFFLLRPLLESLFSPLCQ